MFAGENGVGTSETRCPGRGDGGRGWQAGNTAAESNGLVVGMAMQSQEGNVYRSLFGIFSTALPLNAKRGGGNRLDMMM